MGQKVLSVFSGLFGAFDQRGFLGFIHVKFMAWRYAGRCSKLSIRVYGKHRRDAGRS
jgi:hypothetical protein